MNKVLTIFEGNAEQLFKTADAVETRLKNIGVISSAAVSAPPAATRAQSAAPIVAAEQAATQVAIAESAKREQVEQAASKKSEDLVKQELANHVDFYKARQGVIERQAASEVAMQEKVAAAALKRAEIEKVNDQKQFQYRVALAVEQDKLRLKSVRAAIAAEETQTGVVVRESVKRAEAHRLEFLGHGTFGGGVLEGSLEGTGFARVARGALPALAGFGAVLGVVESIKAYNEQVTEASKENGRLSATSSDLGFAQKDLSKAVDETAVSLRTTKTEAVDLVTAAADLASKTHQPLTDLKDSIIDLASARGIDKSSLPNLLENIGKGTADTALLGQNAAAVFDIYAAKIGKTASQLSEAEKSQALVNRLLSEGALNAGANANALDKDAVSVDALNKSWTKFLATLAAPGLAKAGLDALTKSLGGEPEFGRFDPSRAFNTPGFGSAARADAIGVGRFAISSALREELKPEKIFADDIAAADAESSKRNAEYRRLFQENRQAIIDAAKDPTGNVVNAALSKLNFDQLTKAFPNPDDLRKFLDKQVVDFKSLQDARSRAIETALEQGVGNVGELRRLAKVIPQQIIDPAETKRLSQLASKDIADTFKDAIESAKSKIPTLRDLYKQIAIAPDIGTLGKNGLLRSINDQIDQVIKSQQEKVKQLADSFRSAFDSIVSKDASRNPYLQLLTETDKATRTLIESTRGLSPAIRDALKQRIDYDAQLQRESLRFNTLQTAGNLQNDASSFQRFQDTGSTDSFQVRSLKNFIADQGPLSDGRKKFFDDWLADAQKKDFQQTVDQTIGFANQSFLSGKNPTADERHLFDQAVIGATPLNRVGDLNRDERDQAISARREEAAFQAAQESAAKTREETNNALLDSVNKNLAALLAAITKGKGLPVDLQDQAITNIEVKSKQLGVERSSSPGRPKTTAESMGITDIFSTGGNGGHARP
jgi:hypothetical protein